MAWVQIPLMLAEYTGGQRRLEVHGATVRELIKQLDRQFPGLGQQISEGEKIRPSLVVTVDGQLATHGLNTPVAPNSEVCFLPFLGGG